MKALRNVARRVLPSKAHQSDAVVIFATAIVVLVAASWSNLFELVQAFSRAHPAWPIDHAVAVLFVLTGGMLIYARRRLRELSKEMRARQAAERRAQTLARHDPLTGLPNRRYFTERFTDMLRTAIEREDRVALLLMDLDGFRAVNDVHGYPIGDQTLVEFSERLAKIMPSDALIARIGGDEFGIILPRIGSLERPTRLAHRIVAETSRPFMVAGAATRLGVGIGIAIAPDNGIDVDELIRRADLALYRAKADGTSGIRFFEPDMDTHLERRTSIERELRTAIATGAIEVHFQPLVHLERNRIIGFEALARWTCPQLGAVFPSVFIAIAEESGLIHQLGDQLLRAACRAAAQWPADLTLAFNISPVQMRESSLGLRILAILAETGLPASRLEIEITESAIVDDAVMGQRTIDALRKAGVRIALDDFGTGYATMSQLLSFRFDKIKIDRSFVSRLGQDAESEVIVRAIIGLANGLGLSTTAEGIEDSDQLACLRGNGCREGQGYLFGKAVPASDVPRLLGRAGRAAIAV
jgi:diguanylate cyclase (GGDEF)-like protein